MSFTDIKTKNQGFTIVELLIVVVVIAILAAITIVSYNGITNKANQSAAKAAAATAQKKIELYNSENSRYPITAAELTSSTANSWYLPAAGFGSTDPVTTAGSAQQGTKYVRVQACQAAAGTLSATTITGIRITYYNYGADGVTPGLSTIDLGANCNITAGLANLG